MNKIDIPSMQDKSKAILRSFITLVLMAWGHYAQATHIVGGSISYRCIAKDIYEVTVVMRRDCFNGDPEAYFDNPASIGIFDRTGELLGQLGTKGQLLLKLNLDDTLNEIREDLCTLQGVRSVCVHETTYKGTINLPFRSGGYYLMYQRCCRNMPIQNIQEPLLTGASWVTFISEEAMTECNSAPQFTRWAPTYICAGKPFTMVHNATDPNGDSLVYKLWTPFTGATKSFPKPQPPNKPDFKPVSWIAPYSENDMMGGDPFRIDAKTGEIFAQPNTLGVYVLGLKVEEYRKGKLIGTVYRDFEVNVIDCANLIDAKIDAPTLQCDNLTVNFKSENSTNADKTKWFFDFDRNKNATSDLANPTYQYTDTGFYKVALVITKDSACFDTAFHFIHLKSSASIQAKFITQPGTCVNGNLTLFLIDQSTGLDPTATYLWTITYSNQTQTSTLKNPVIIIPNTVSATVRLTIRENGNGCEATQSKTFITSFLNPGDHRDQWDVCTGDTVKINFILSDSIKGKYTYTWDPSPLILRGANTPEPVIKSNVNQSVYLFVTVDNKTGCTSRDSILIRSLTKPNLNFILTNTCGSLSVKVVNLSDQLTNYLFNFGDGSTSTEREPAHTYAKAGNYTVTLSTTDDCAPSISKTISLGLLPCIQLRDTIAGCKELALRINPKANPLYSYKWRPNSKLNDLNIPNPMFVVDSPRTFIADIFDVNTGIGLGTHTIVVVLPVSDEIQRIKDTVLACAGIGVPLNPGGSTKLKYTWTPAQFLDNPTSANPIAKVDIITRFTVVITNPTDTCVLSKQLVVILPSKIAAAVIPDSLAACTNVGVNLNPNGKADPNLKYLWSPANLLDDATKINPVATITVPTVFTVTISDIRFNNCQVTKTVKLSIPIIEELNKLKDSVSACAGVPVALNPSGNPGFRYEWTPSTGLNNPLIANPTATLNFTTVYTARITDTLHGGCFITKQVKVIILLGDAIKNIKDTIIACSGQGIGLNPAGNPALKYTWSPAQFLNNANAANPIATVTQVTTFTVTIANTNDSCAAGSKQVVVVVPVKLALDLIPDSLQACISVPINLNPNGKADPNLKYLWTPAGVLDDATKFNPVAKITVPTVFTVTISDIRFNNCQITKSVKLGIPLVEELNRLKDSVSACAGVPIALNPSGTSGFKYEWTPSTGLNNPFIANPTATLNFTATYNVRITDTLRGGCFVTKQVKVIIRLSDAIKDIKDTVIACSGQGIALNPTGNPALKYTWSPAQFLNNANAANPIATVTQVTTFTVTIANTTDSCAAGSKQVVVVVPVKLALDLIPDSLQACVSVPINLNPNGKADPNLKYQWTPVGVLDDATKFNPVATITVPTVFTVTITDIRFANCTLSKTVKVGIPLVDELNKIKDSISACSGVPTPLNPTGDSRFKYAWSPATGLDNPNLANPTVTVQTTTTYSVTVTDIQRGNCQLTKQVKVIVPPAFTVVPSFRDTISCTANSFVIKVSSNNPAVTFEWFNPAGTSIGRGDTVQVNPTQRTTYRVTGTDQFGCQKSDTIRIDPSAVRIAIAVPGGGLVCEGDSIQLQVTNLNPNQVLTYVWTPTTEIVRGANTANPVIRPTASRKYFVQATNAQGCATRDSVDIRFSNVETITVTATPTSIVIGQPSQITATNIPGYTYSWTPTTGLSNPSIPNPVATPTQTTTYRLTATNPDGCIQIREVTITVTVPVCDRPNIFLPNAFTPNGDGKNDVLFLRGLIVDRMSLVIYNRWGEKVFESTNQSVGWDGTFRGKLLPPDVYAYYLVVDCIGGDRFTEQGNVTILR